MEMSYVCFLAPPLRGLESGDTPVAVSTHNIQILGFNAAFAKRNRVLWGNGRSQNEGRASTAGPGALALPESKDGLKEGWTDTSKGHQSQLPGAPAGKTWEI